MALKRLQKEYSELLRNPIPFGCIEPTDDPLVWKAFLNGPEETPYDGGVFEIEMRFLSNYPIAPPAIRFVTKIFHPNVQPNGWVCISLLGEWRPTDNITTALMALNNLLVNPRRDGNYSMGLNDQQFFEKARDYTQRFAKK